MEYGVSNIFVITGNFEGKSRLISVLNGLLNFSGTKMFLQGERGPLILKEKVSIYYFDNISKIYKFLKSSFYKSP